MRRLWRLATRNWSVNPGRTAAALLSIAIGVGTVVAISSVYETARRAIKHETLTSWLGGAHVSVYPIGAHWGTLDASLTQPLGRLSGVKHVSARLKRRMQLVRYDATNPNRIAAGWLIDALGIDVQDESHFRTLPALEGRQFRVGERGTALMEREMAEPWGAAIGQPITIIPNQGGRPKQFTVIGMFDSFRVADFQRPYVYLPLEDLQGLSGEPGAATTIDIIVEDSSAEGIAEVAAAVSALLAERQLTYQCRVETAAGRQMLLDEAERLSGLTLLLVAVVAMLTSFFIILTTMSISLFERRTALGILRCIGMTRGQLAVMLLVELVPLGVLGTGLGIVGGIGAMKLIEWGADDAHLTLHLSTWGTWLAVASGIITALVATLFLIVQVVRVTPLTAVHVEASPPRTIYLLLAGAVGLALIGLHEFMVLVPAPVRWLEGVFATIGTASVYLGYVLVTPAAVVLLGPLVARVIGPLLGVRTKLAVDQFGRAPWRSTGVCWMLVVGLSLIVYIGIGAETVMNVYDFPAELPDGFAWARALVPADVVGRVAKVPGVRNVTALTDADCHLDTPDARPAGGPGSVMGRLMDKLTRPVFVACDPERVFNMVRVTFDEGSMPDALEKLRQGGYVVIPAQTARNKGLHVGDRIVVGINDRAAEFTVAAVVQAPVLDLTVTAFQAHSYMQFAAASVIFGTHEDLRRAFGMDVVSLIMCDLDLAPTPPPAEFLPTEPPEYGDERQLAASILRWADALPNEQDRLNPVLADLEAWLAASPRAAPHHLRSALRRYQSELRYVALRWDRQAPEQRWAMFRERLVLARVAEAFDRPGIVTGSVRRMKEYNERILRQAIAGLTWLPAIVLVAAAIGIGNLMMVSVQIRARQLAILRAVGAVRSQVVRLVLAESVALAIVGSLSGIALGIHLAISDNRVTGALLAFRPEVRFPVDTLALGVLLTLGVCLLAGIIPARRAARNNVLEALQAT